MSPEMTNALEIVLKTVAKKYGKGLVMKLTDEPVVDLDNVVPSGSLALDSALGIGGYRKGRIVEIFGPESSGKTTLCLHGIANAQKQGKICAFIDAEHALDPIYASGLGVDLEKLLVSQPDYGEQALDLVDILAKSGEVNLIVIDSVAALVPKNELEGDMGQSHVGLQARMMSQAMRKLAGTVNQTGCIIMFVNQIRMKIGVMFGCFHYNARVLLADGTTEKIGKIVNNKMNVKVMSKAKDGRIEPKRIIDWHDNGLANKFYNIIVNYPHGNGRSSLPIGDDHKIFTPIGERLASELKIGDEVLVRSQSYLSKQQKEVAIGTFLGDGSLRVNDAQNTASLRLGHGQAQYTYLQYKTRYLGDDFMGNFYKTGNNGWGCDSQFSNELVWLAKYKSGKSIRFVDQDLLNSITSRSVAIWYLDDGTFSGSYKYWGWGKSEISAKNMEQSSKEAVVERFVELGLPRPTITSKGFMFSGKTNRDFHKIIAQYVPVCMTYKIHPKFRWKCTQIFSDSRPNPNFCITNELIPAKIVDIYDKPISKNTHKFDITVKDNQSYFIDNVLVHNSPETTSGGNALKFYASQRLDIRRIGSIKEGDRIIGNRTKVKVVKNKLAPPFRIAEFDIRFGIGIDKIAELLDLAVEDGVIKKAGAWYSYNGERVGQGRPNSIALLKEDDKLRLDIKREVMELRGLVCDTQEETESPDTSETSET